MSTDVDQIDLGSGPVTIQNNDLYVTVDNNVFNVEGKMDYVQPADIAKLGYASDVHNLFIVKVTFEGEIIPSQFTGTCIGTETKPIVYSKFDGPNYIYYVLNGNIKKFTITYKSNNSEPERTIIINNNAELKSA